MGVILVIAAGILVASIVIGMVVMGVLLFGGTGSAADTDLSSAGCILVILGILSGLLVIYFAVQYASDGTLHLPVL